MACGIAAAAAARPRVHPLSHVPWIVKGTCGAHTPPLRPPSVRSHVPFCSTAANHTVCVRKSKLNARFQQRSIHSHTCIASVNRAPYSRGGDSSRTATAVPTPSHHASCSLYRLFCSALSRVFLSSTRYNAELLGLVVLPLFLFSVTFPE